MNKELLFIISLMLFSLNCIAENSVATKCKKLVVDYARSCGDAANVNSLPGLELGECAVMQVNSKSVWNASGLRFDSGSTYLIKAKEDDTWCDASIETNAQGWQLDKQYNSCVCEETIEFSGVNKLFFSMAEYLGLRRYSDANWFELIGVNKNKTEKEETVIGLKNEIVANKTGEFCAYANDMSGFYFNNKGSVNIEITRINHAE
ncbi:MAG: hypothetical protein KAS57_02275 [Gammaproteobacteria bacterium]|nr:hypothetical protein [Gammaproteobacteria bacterium]